MYKFLFKTGICLLIFLSFTTRIEAQEITEDKYIARITGVKKEIVEEQETTEYTLEIIKGKEAREKIVVQASPEDKGLEVKNYKVGDKVIVLSSKGERFQQYFIIDHVRTSPILLLTLIFILLTVAIGRRIGVQSLLGLALTTVVLLTVIVPTIESGGNVLSVSILGSLLIATISIYLSHGFNRKSTIALIGTIISIGITLVMSLIFTNTLKLTGYSTEESMYLLSFEEISINMKNLLIASLIFGGIGILDDVTVSQVSVVKELYDTNKGLNTKVLYQKAMNVGKDHISSMVNTLFLAYASASLPLIILLRLRQATLIEIVNNEAISEEILRTLVGSIGLILAVPITTALAVYFLKRKQRVSLHDHKQT